MKKNKVCLITGGAGFLGKNFCKFFLEENYIVLCLDNNKKNIKELKSQNLKNLFIYNCDVSKEKEVKDLFILIHKSFQIDVLINNATIDAIPSKKNNYNNKFPTVDMWDQELDSSLKASFLMIKYFGEQMAKRNKGSIINIGSDLSIIAPNQKIYKHDYKDYIKPVTYSVIKHGILGLTKYFAALYGENKVRVNTLSPGPVKNNQKKGLLREIKKATPMKRLGSPNDLNGVLLFLASDASSYITGQNILVDGGKTII